MIKTKLFERLGIVYKMVRKYGLLKYIGWLKYLSIYFAAAIVSPFLKHKKRFQHLWIICERGVDARDNGYHLFRYIRENHPEVNIVYIISKDSVDFKKINSLGKFVGYKTFLHYVYLILSEVKISTHVMGYAPKTNLFVQLNRLSLLSGKQIYIKHGIIYSDIVSSHYPRVQFDLLVCAAIPEYKFILENFGHPAHCIQLLGLARYDALLQNQVSKSKQILLMPTWRTFLDNVSTEEFVGSDYYQFFNHLFNCKSLCDLLERKGYTLVFYLHFNFQRFLPAFSSSSDRVIFASFDKYDVQQLLIESDVLITDFSSVCFDFAYMKKPEIYIQFDKKEFRAHHQKMGYFDHDRDGFGPVVENENDLISALDTILQNGAEMEEIYRLRVDRFFTIRDTNNCKRIYEAIEKIVLKDL